MKKFKFTLQTVHKVRELNSERENLTLHELQKEAEQAASRVTHIESLRHEAVEKYVRRLKSGNLNPHEMELSANHFASLNALQKEAQKAADEKRQACARQMEVVKAARIEMKVTDKLRADQKKRHQCNVELMEQKAIDELVSTKFARRIQRSK